MERDSLLDVLQTNMEALGDETVADLLVHDDTDCAGGYVPNTAGTSVVERVGHACTGGGGGVEEGQQINANELWHLCGWRRWRQCLLDHRA